MNKKFFNTIQTILIISLSIFGLFIAYQLILKITGHSWATENIVIAFLVFNIGLTFTIAFNLVQLMSDHNHLSKQFYSLAKDFKEHITNN
jgi:uncharacterized membrane protein